MKATLNLENIGNKVGKQELNFNSGIVSIITGRTASGKSRFIKSCALALSYPISSEQIKKEAINFGIIQGENADFSPLVNSNKEKAIIKLQYNDVVKKVDLNRNGSIKINIPGNQQFLDTSMLVKNSRIHNNFNEDNPDFSWIVNEMSFAKDYETVLEIIDSYFEQINSKKEEIGNKEIQLKEDSKGLEESNKEKRILEKKIKELEEELKHIQIAPDLQDKKIEFMGTIKVVQDRLEKNEIKLKKYKTEKQDFEKQLVKNEKEIKDIDSKLIEMKTDQREKKNLPLIDKLQMDIIKIQESIPKITERRGELNKEIKFWKEEVVDENGICRICGIIHKECKIPSDIIEKKREKSETERNDIEKKLKECNKEIDEKQKLIKEKRKLPDIIINIKDHEGKRLKLSNDLDRAYVLKDRLDSDINSINKKIDPDKKQLEKLNKDLKNTVNKIKEEEKSHPLHMEKSLLNKQLGGIENKISNLEKTIQKGNYIEIFNKKADLDKAKMIIDDLEEILSNIKNHLNLKIKEQREGASNKFNASIKKLIQELNFAEIKEIFLDLENYHLKVIRRDNTLQEISSLSGGERVVIASLIQISAKDAYLPEIPFLIGDDIIFHDIDPVRLDILLNFLKDFAKKKDWFVLLTRVTNEDLTISELQ